LVTGGRLKTAGEPSAGISNAALARFARSLQRQPAPSPSATLSLPAGFAVPFSGEGSIDGPLPAGAVRESHGLTVTQADDRHAEIVYGDSVVRLGVDPGDTYAYSIGPPIALPPAPQPQLGPLIQIPDPEAKPVLPQRLVRVTATSTAIADQRIDQAARVPPLAVQTRIVSAREVAEFGTGMLGLPDVNEFAGDGYAQLELEDSLIRIEVAADAAAVAGDPKRARFAYWIDPEWTGAQSDEKRVVIVASPGVKVRRGWPANAPALKYGRKLVEEVVRVPHPNLVPEQGTRLAIEKFVSIDVAGANAPELQLPGFTGIDAKPGSTEVDVATGLAGVSIQHPWSGARLTLRPTNAELGAAYAWQVLPPLDGAPGEIRAVVAPGVDVELAEPVPYRLRDPMGGTRTPRRGQAQSGEGLQGEGFELNLIQVSDPANVPQQGTPLNIDYLLGFGQRREPDRHQWLGTDDLPFMIATAGTDLIISLIPIVGQLYMIGEFAYTMATGHDWWGNEVDDGGKVVMGFGAALSLIPLVGGLGALLRGGAKAGVIAEFAARWGTTTEELQAVLVRVGTAAEGEDAALVQRAMRAIEKGEQFSEEEVPALRRVLARVGAGNLAIEGIARSATGQLELALAAGGEALASENYLENLMSAVRTTGAVPDSLAAPLARSGQFANAEEVEAAVKQALRDLARAEGVAADMATIEAVAQRTGSAVSELQAAAIVELTPQTRNLAVARPDLVAEYERLVTERLPDVVRDVLAHQGQTPNRTRLAQLRREFDQLRTEVGDAQRLTSDQRDTAHQILREARDLARDDFDNVRDGVWRRLRNPRRNPDLAQIEQQLRTAGDVQGPQTGALRLRTAGATGDIGFDPMNIEHRVRLSDNPWLYNDPANMLASDAAQNQQYLESLRQQGSIWPSNAVEEFIVRFGLNDQGINFAPHSR
jgi:hypothetical protein